MSRFRSKTCPVCGGVGRFHTYCSAACKQKAYRQRVAKKRELLTQTVCSALVEDMGVGDAMQVFNELNQIPFANHVGHVDEAIRLIINSYRHKISELERIINHA